MKESERLKEKYKYHLNPLRRLIYQPLTEAIKALKESEEKVEDYNDLADDNLKLMEKMQQLEKSLRDQALLIYQLEIKNNQLQKNLITDEFQSIHGQWSDKTFGKRYPIAPLHHLKKEVEELIAEPYDIEEYADGFLLLMDSARMAGFSMTKIKQAMTKKFHQKQKQKMG